MASLAPLALNTSSTPPVKAANKNPLAYTTFYSRSWSAYSNSARPTQTFKSGSTVVAL
jgi:hypothetical protein